MTPPTPATGSSTSAEALIREAHFWIERWGIQLSPSKVSRLVREYKHRVEQNGFPFLTFLVNTVQLTTAQRARAKLDPEIARVINYADKTGELAVNNVLRRRGF